MDNEMPLIGSINEECVENVDFDVIVGIPL